MQNYVKVIRRIAGGRAERRTDAEFLFFNDVNRSEVKRALSVARLAVFNGDRAVVLRRPGSEWADVPAVGECPKVARKRLFASVL